MFYVFFCLSLLCIVAVLGAERLRAASQAGIAVLTDRWARRVFLLTVGCTIGVAWLVFSR